MIRKKRDFALDRVSKILRVTIKDAITWTNCLGKGYQWVDIIYINQLVKEDEKEQIYKMWSTHSGA